MGSCATQCLSTSEPSRAWPSRSGMKCTTSTLQRQPSSLASPRRATSTSQPLTVFLPRWFPRCVFGTPTWSASWERWTGRGPSTCSGGRRWTPLPTRRTGPRGTSLRSTTATRTRSVRCCVSSALCRHSTSRHKSRGRDRATSVSARRQTRWPLSMRSRSLVGKLARLPKKLRGEWAPRRRRRASRRRRLSRARGQVSSSRPLSSGPATIVMGLPRRRPRAKHLQLRRRSISVATTRMAGISSRSKYPPPSLAPRGLRRGETLLSGLLSVSSAQRLMHELLLSLCTAVGATMMCNGELLRSLTAASVVGSARGSTWFRCSARFDETAPLVWARKVCIL
mmetsp:Transcript_4423/g.9563  ORF Transcript_4423/g.9563 Transcript_4423/m.9563 type:complete len:338 (-) Transcript_4423:455-1468(-)